MPLSERGNQSTTMKTMASECERIAEQLGRAYHGEAWHGPSFREAIEDVSESVALRQPPAAHRIIEIVAHVSLWLREVHDVLAGKPYVSLTGTAEWPELASIGSWAALRTQLEQNVNALTAAVRVLPDGRLEQVIAPQKNYTVYQLLHGTAEHLAYHAGQIALLKK